MTISALTVRKYTRTPGSQSENAPHTHAEGEDEREESRWLTTGNDDSDNDALRRHLLPGLDLPVPSSLQSNSEGVALLSTLHANDFLPSVLDDKDERLYEGPNQPCTKSELKRAVSALIALNRAQSESIQALSYQWSVRQREMGWKISRLESSLRLHYSLLVKIVDNMQMGRQDPAYWTGLQTILPHFHGERNAGYVPGCDGLNSTGARDQEAAWEADDVLSDAPANWTTKLFDWSSKVDCLPIAEVGMCKSVSVSTAEDRGAPPSESTGDIGVANGESAEPELPTCEEQGLNVHVMESAGAPLSAAAKRDAEHFRDFIRNASLRQEAWMDTFSSFAVTAAPTDALSSTSSLKLQLLDEAVTLPATDLLLIVAESVEPLEDSPLQAGMRVLCLLERSVAVKCSVKSGNLRKGASVTVHAFEPFCVCVQPNCGDTDSPSSSKTSRKVLTVPVCSLQRIKLVRGAPSPGSSSVSSSDTLSSNGAGEIRGPAVRVCGSRNTNSNNASPDSLSSDGSSSRSGKGGCNNDSKATLSAGTGEREPAQSTGERSLQGGQSISEAKKRKMQDDELELKENSTGLVYTGERCHDAAGRRQETAEQRQQQLVHRDDQTNAQPDTKQHESASRTLQCQQERASSSSSSSSSSSVGQHSPKNICTDSVVSTRPSDGCVGVANPASADRQDAGGTRQVPTDSNEGGRETSATSRKPSNDKDSSPPADACSEEATASAAAAAESLQRTGTPASVRCSGQAAKQQLESMRQRLPRVRTVPPKELRQQLPAFDCDECSAFFEMVGKAPCCQHGQQNFKEAELCKEGGEQQQASVSAADQRMWSRHRQFAAPPSTPPGYWDL